MLVKSAITVRLDVSADAQQLDDGTMVITRPRLVREIGMESGADFLGLPEHVRTEALTALAKDARAFVRDMSGVAA